ncbi:MAG: DnaJ domain-containing protein [Methylobacteriaceae bacterium]|nr:DnaJ domain-containing protein [Methylobacteriaceae bacterium]
MSTDSPLFDRIRISPRGNKAKENAVPTCEFPGCTNPGTYKAPKGRQHEGRYWHFCLTHVREYNAAYNYFEGMTDEAVQAYQKDSLIGHRPTWTMGSSNSKNRKNGSDVPERDWAYSDPLGILKDAQLRAQAAKQPEVKQRVIPGTVRRALETLDLDETADAQTIRVTYKRMVKKFHPDAHGGDRAFEERLREIIKAHAVLKAAGFC